MENQNTMNIEELEVISQLTDFGPETVDGIKMSGIEVALYDLGIGAASLGIWSTARIAQSALSKLNAKAATHFFAVADREQAPGVRYKAGTSYTCHGPATSTKVNRNAPCTCGSGKKSKKCCK